MARSTVVTLTTSPQNVEITQGAYIEIQPLASVTSGSLSVTGDGTAVSEADDTDVMALVAGATMVVSRPSDGIISAIASGSVKVAFRSLSL